MFIVKTTRFNLLFNAVASIWKALQCGPAPISSAIFCRWVFCRTPLNTILFSSSSSSSLPSCSSSRTSRFLGPSASGGGTSPPCSLASCRRLRAAWMKAASGISPGRKRDETGGRGGSARSLAAKHSQILAWPRYGPCSCSDLEQGPRISPREGGGPRLGQQQGEGKVNGVPLALPLKKLKLKKMY